MDRYITDIMSDFYESKTTLKADLKRVTTGAWAFFTLFVITLVGYVWAVQIYEHRITNLKKDLEYYRSTYIRNQGCTTLWKGSHGQMINYNLLSLDGGHNWYAVTNKDPDNTIVIGNAEQVYPGLRETLAAWDGLIDYVSKHGPISLTNEEGLKLLYGSVLTVTNK